VPRCKNLPSGGAPPKVRQTGTNAGLLFWPACRIKGLDRMTQTIDTVAGIISDVCNIERDQITPDTHVIKDLGIDSLDFLDVTFAIDKSFGIKMPVEKWTQEVNEGKVPAETYFIMKNLSARIDELVAAKAS
jgi:acyl carrier protein